jgi:hypothetical protein
LGIYTVTNYFEERLRREFVKVSLLSQQSFLALEHDFSLQSQAIAFICTVLRSTPCPKGKVDALDPKGKSGRVTSICWLGRVTWPMMTPSSNWGWT